MNKIKVPDEVKKYSNNNKEIDVSIKNTRKKISLNEEKWLHCIRVVILILAVLITLAVAVTYISHLIISEEYRWLSSEDIAKIKDLAVSIIVGLTLSISTAYFFKK